MCLHLLLCAKVTGACKFGGYLHTDQMWMKMCFFELSLHMTQISDFLSAFAVKSNCYLCKESKFEQMCRNIKDLHMWQILRKFALKNYIYLRFVHKLLKNRYPNFPALYQSVQIKSKFKAPNLQHICSTRKHS